MNRKQKSKLTGIRYKSVSEIKVFSVDNVAKRLRGILKVMVKPHLLKEVDGKRAVDFMVSRNADNHIVLEVVIRHGPFLNSVSKHKYTYVNDYAITERELQNFVMHSLTFPFSPFYLTKKGFDKHIELYG